MTSPVRNGGLLSGRTQESAEVAAIVEGYIFTEPAIELGVLMQYDEPDPSSVVRIPFLC